jgi:hypothetical protein
VSPRTCQSSAFLLPISFHPVSPVLFRLENLYRNYRALGHHLLRPRDFSLVARFLLALALYILSPSPLVLLHHLFLLLSSLIRPSFRVLSPQVFLSSAFAPSSALAPSLSCLLLLVLSPLTPGSVLLSSSSFFPLSCLGLFLSSRAHPRALACFNYTGSLSQLAMQS